MAVGIELALFIVVVPEQLRGLGNIVQCDEEYSRVIRVLIYGEGLNIGVVERMIHGCTHVKELLGLPSYGSILQGNGIVFLEAEYLKGNFTI